MPSRPHSIYIEDELWRKATERASETGSSAASIVNTALTLHFDSVTTGHEVSQMSHLSTSPTHRPLAEPLDQRVESGSSVSPTADRTAASAPPVPKTPQQRRDEILHGVATPPRTKR